MEVLQYAIIVAFILSTVAGAMVIPFLTKLKFGQRIRNDGPKAHIKKMGTPTMGGIIFLLPVFIVSFFLTQGVLNFVLAAILTTLGYSLIGFADDYIKVVMKRSLGLRASQKLLGQIAIAVVFAYYAYSHPELGSNILIPFTGAEWELGIWYIPFIAFVIVGTTNAVNLTDGLDGLAAGVSLVVAAAFTVIAAFLASSANQEGLQYIASNYEGLAIFGGALAAALLGFLRFNIYPAKVFMGDTGSMGLGGAIAAIAVLLRLPLFLPVIGGIYMLETLSVIVQVIYFRTTGKRLFRMSPLHHHFEIGGMPEPKIVIMFVAATFILSLIGVWMGLVGR